jgi:hypothetical protein
MVAQANRPFTDAWFWGAKVGALAFSTTRIENGFAPTVGAEWLITRNRGALYLSIERSFFSEQSTLDPSSSTIGVVDVKDLTRVGFALMAFPKINTDLRMYGGIGMSLGFIKEAQMANGGGALEDALIEEASSIASFQMIGGVQKELRSLSLFGQVVVIPYSSDFLLNGRATFGLEAGVRWNLGGSIDNMR